VSEVVYLDLCCLKRPFDDQRSAQIQLETAASDVVAVKRRRLISFRSVVIGASP